MSVQFVEHKAMHGRVATIYLNRPQVLNALSLAMIKSISEQLLAWKENPMIKAVLIRSSSPRAFCAGGDLRYLYQQKQQGVSIDQLMQYFLAEGRLNKIIYHYTKPYVALMNGIVMGGGFGISIPGRYRVASDDLKLAMPEARIGFFTDAGASYFLPRCPGKIGYYLALTGNSIAAADAFYLGLIDYPLLSTVDINKVETLFYQADWSLNAWQQCDAILKKVSCDAPSSALIQDQEAINYLFDVSELKTIFIKLAKIKNQRLRKKCEVLAKNSPSSLQAIFALLKRSQSLDFDACIAEEQKVAASMLASHDFFEGIRATIIDKDYQSKWQLT